MATSNIFMSQQKNFFSYASLLAPARIHEEMQGSKGPTRLKQLKRLPQNTVVPHVANHLDALGSTIAASPGDSAAPSERAVHILHTHRSQFDRKSPASTGTSLSLP